MVSERIQRQIDRLRDEAEQASAEQNWELVLEKARYVLTFDPENSARAAFLAVAESAMGARAKADGSPVTEADMASHRVIVAGVEGLNTPYPILS
ncbi:MAG: hypothetical protein QF898_17270, partial [SAR202 cluster bacterium]|nr:hypothetical protein [SAR202 cluster bacterium]